MLVWRDGPIVGGEFQDENEAQGLARTVGFQKFVHTKLMGAEWAEKYREEIILARRIGAVLVGLVSTIGDESLWEFLDKEENEEWAAIPIRGRRKLGIAIPVKTARRIAALWEGSEWIKVATKRFGRTVSTAEWALAAQFCRAVMLAGRQEGEQPQICFPIQWGSAQQDEVETVKLILAGNYWHKIPKLKTMFEEVQKRNQYMEEARKWEDRIVPKELRALAAMRGFYTGRSDV